MGERTAWTSIGDCWRLLRVELYEGHLDKAAHLAEEQGVWESVEVKEDLTHRPRILVARLAK